MVALNCTGRWQSLSLDAEMTRNPNDGRLRRVYYITHRISTTTPSQELADYFLPFLLVLLLLCFILRAITQFELLEELWSANRPIFFSFLCHKRIYYISNLRLFRNYPHHYPRILRPDITPGHYHRLIVV